MVMQFALSPGKAGFQAGFAEAEVRRPRYGLSKGVGAGRGLVRVAESVRRLVLVGRVSRAQGVDDHTPDKFADYGTELPAMLMITEIRNEHIQSICLDEALVIGHWRPLAGRETPALKSVPAPERGKRHIHRVANIVPGFRPAPS